MSLRAFRTFLRPFQPRLPMPPCFRGLSYFRGDPSTARVLSVQSHVVHGYVGNRAAVFPLQVLGFEVDVINSVQFCCHTGYPSFAGQKLDGSDLRTLVDGLEHDEVLDHTHLLTGFIGTATFLNEVVQLLDRLPKECKWVCDPVLGDHGVLYTSQELVEVFRTVALPRASVLTPNQFEAELLADRKIGSLAEAIEVCEVLHKLGPSTILLTTLDVPDATDDGACVAMLLSEAGGQKWLLKPPRIEGSYTGTGDLTSAMFLAWRHMHPYEAPLALEKAASVLRGVIQETVTVNKSREVKGKRVLPELRLIQSKNIIEHPPMGMQCHLATPLGLRCVSINLDSLLDEQLQGMKLCSTLLGDKGVQLALSSASLPKIDKVKEEFRLGEEVLAATSDKVVAECCAKWGIQASAVLLVGGSAAELSAGKAVGCHSVAVLTQANESSELMAAADFAISSLEALGRFLP